MEFETILKNRYSCKKFNGETIPEEKLQKLLGLIRLAPSSFGLMPWRIVVIDDAETKEKLLPATYNQPQTTTCSHILVFCADLRVEERIDAYEKLLIDKRGETPEFAKEYTDRMRATMRNRDRDARLRWAREQIFIALTNALYGAASLGIDSCPMGGFNAEQYAEILDLPDHLVPTVVTTVGYRADEPKTQIRYPMEDLLVGL